MSNSSSAGQLVDQAKVIGSDVRELGSLAKAATKETVREARDRVGDFFGPEGELAESIRRSPFRSVLIAAGAGILLNWWMRRR